MASDTPFKWRQFEPKFILLCVRWYLRYSLIYRDAEDMVCDRGLSVHHTTIFRWVQRYAPHVVPSKRVHFAQPWTVEACVGDYDRVTPGRYHGGKVIEEASLRLPATQALDRVHLLVERQGHAR